MTDPAELLARTTAHGPRLDGGRGGIPDLTPADIAGALGMTRRTVGRELLAWYHTITHESPSRLPPALDAGIGQIIASERAARLHAHADACLALESTRIAAEAYRHPPDDLRYRVIRLTEAAARARAATWPDATSPTWRRLRMAVAHEACGPSACGRCHGTGHVKTDDALHACPTCDGIGRDAASGCARARWLGVTEPAYRKTWRDVYSAIHAILCDSVAAARDAFAKAID